MEALPLRDERRVAHGQVDRFSSQHISTWTQQDTGLHGGVFEDHLADYMGWEAPAVVPRVAQMLPRSRGGPVPLGPHGWELGTANMPGDDWRLQHDTFGDAVFADSVAAGVRGTQGPRQIFAHVIPPQVLNQDLADPDEGRGAHALRQPRRRRQRRREKLAIIPDSRFYRRSGPGGGGVRCRRVSTTRRCTTAPTRTRTRRCARRGRCGGTDESSRRLTAG